MNCRLYSILVVLLLMGCEGDDSDDNPYGEWIVTTFNIIDHDTRKPIAGAHLRIYYTTHPGGIEISWEGASNFEGEVKWEHREAWTLQKDQWFASKDHYKDIGCHSFVHGALKQTTELHYATYFKFKVINEEPTSNDDKLTINYNTLHCISQGSIDFEGGSVDQVIIAEASPSHDYSIGVNASGANELTQLIEFDWKSRDTTLVVIRY